MFIKTELSDLLSHFAFVISCEEGVLIPVLLMEKLKQKRPESPGDPARQRQRQDSHPDSQPSPGVLVFTEFPVLELMFRCL